MIAVDDVEGRRTSGSSSAVEAVKAVDIPDDRRREYAGTLTFGQEGSRRYRDPREPENRMKPITHGMWDFAGT